MVKYSYLPDTIFQLLPKAISYLESHPQIIFAFLFGSLTQGRAFPLSDVDIAVYLKEDANFAVSKLDILGKLIDILQTDEIDLVILNTAKLPLVINILKTKDVVVDKEPFIRHLFESLITRKYFDFAVRESNLLRRRYMHG
jgi:predicted nucleotidyltransferase